MRTAWMFRAGLAASLLAIAVADYAIAIGRLGPSSGVPPGVLREVLRAAVVESSMLMATAAGLTLFALAAYLIGGRFEGLRRGAKIGYWAAFALALVVPVHAIAFGTLHTALDHLLPANPYWLAPAVVAGACAAAFWSLGLRVRRRA